MTTRYLKDPAGKKMRVFDVDGYLIPARLPGIAPELIKQQFEYIRNFNCRDDDVVLLSYPKTGTNWLNEVILMLLNKSHKTPITSKVKTMLEFVTQETVDDLLSPRCLNTHVLPKYLPKDLKEKQLRTVLVVRNPKDMLVSYYNHVKGFRAYEYDGDWKGWFQMYMDGEMQYGLYKDYLMEFEKAMADGIGFPLHLIHYEELKLNGLEEVKKLAKFLKVDVDEELCQAIVDACSFDKMKRKDILPEEVKHVVLKEGFQFFRKGQIGDWMNWFTVAQNEQFDQYWERNDRQQNQVYIHAKQIDSRAWVFKYRKPYLELS